MEDDLVKSTNGTIPTMDKPVLLKEQRMTLEQRVRSAVFFVYFLGYLVVYHSFQLVMLPLGIVVPEMYEHVITRIVKAGFGSLIISLCAWFGPTKFVITADPDFPLDQVIERDASGKVTRIRFAKRSLWISNHQQYGDWLYLWILMAYGRIATGLQIILKASLRWAPIVGPAMQLFRFAFIDKAHPLQKAGVDRYARDAQRAKAPYALLLFPEGTLVSRLTRPRSAAFAKQTGVQDFRNTLVPRSAGMLYCLRTLMSIAPDDLAVYDVTIGYSGVPDQGYAQDYYTLLSIFGRGLSPKRVHIHLSRIDTSAIPYGHLSTNTRAARLDEEVTEAERDAFSKWLYERWQRKDALMNDFYKRGSFPHDSRQGSPVELPIEMRVPKDYVDLLVVPVAWAILVSVVFFGLRWRHSGLPYLYERLSSLASSSTPPIPHEL